MKKNAEETPMQGRSATKIQVLHDDKGNIFSCSVVKSGVLDRLSLVPKQNQSTKVVDMPIVEGEKLSNEEDFKRLVENVKQYKVDMSSKEGKLIRKTA